MPSESVEQVRIHGTLVDVAAVGLLLTGRSGIGKSECALELVMRSHRLVADDVVLIEIGESGRPEGYSPELVRHYLELRGIGIVHVPSLFGSSAVSDRGPIDLVIHLEAWEAKPVERLGLERRTEVIAGVEVDAIHLPVAPGRNVAALVEVAARNLRMQRTGRIAAAELDQRVLETLRGKLV
jgi:HPr kinase/phosphorylase